MTYVSCRGFFIYIIVSGRCYVLTLHSLQLVPSSISRLIFLLSPRDTHGGAIIACQFEGKILPVERLVFQTTFISLELPRTRRLVTHKPNHA